VPSSGSITQRQADPDPGRLLPFLGEDRVRRALALERAHDQVFAAPVDLGDEIDRRALGSDAELGLVALPLHGARRAGEPDGERERLVDLRHRRLQQPARRRAGRPPERSRS